MQTLYDPKLYHPKSISIRPEDCFEGIGLVERVTRSGQSLPVNRATALPSSATAAGKARPCDTHVVNGSNPTAAAVNETEAEGGEPRHHAGVATTERRAILQRGLDRQEALRQLQKALCIDVPPTLQRWKDTEFMDDETKTKATRTETVAFGSDKNQSLMTFASPPISSNPCPVYHRELREIQQACRSWREWLAQEKALRLEAANAATSSSPVLASESSSASTKALSRRQPSSTALQFRHMLWLNCQDGSLSSLDTGRATTVVSAHGADHLSSVISLWQKEVQETRRCYQILKDEEEKAEERKALRWKAKTMLGSQGGEDAANANEPGVSGGSDPQGNRFGSVLSSSLPDGLEEEEDPDGWLFTLQRRLQRTAGFRNAVSKAVSLVPGGHCGMPPADDFHDGVGCLTGGSSAATVNADAITRNISSCGAVPVFSEAEGINKIGEGGGRNGSTHNVPRTPLSVYLDRLQLLSPLFAEMNTRVRMLNCVCGAGVDGAQDRHHPGDLPSSAFLNDEDPLQRFRETMEAVYHDCFLPSAQQLSDNIKALEERYRKIIECEKQE